MSEAALPRARVLRSPIGMKALMAVTGVILFGFVLGHMLGNLQIFLGAAKLNAYAVFLHTTPSLLWTARVVLGVSVLLHIFSAVQLTAMSRAARPVRYRMHKPVASTYASRTMMFGGVIVLAFVVYHLLHFTTGHAHPNFRGYKHVYDNVVAGFSVWWVSAAYMFAQLLLGMHLFHGVWSMFQSIGFSHPRYTPRLKTFAAVFAFVVVAGNCSIPIAVLAGVIR